MLVNKEQLLIHMILRKYFLQNDWIFTSNDCFFTNESTKSAIFSIGCVRYVLEFPQSFPLSTEVRYVTHLHS